MSAAPVTATWRFDYRPMPSLPPLAWLATVHPAEARVDVACGSSVRTEENGFFEGTWVGPPNLSSVLETTTVFGSGMVARHSSLYAVPPAHTMEGIFLSRASGSLVISNSLAAILTGAGLQLDPNVDYPSLFFGVTKGIGASPIELPTMGAPVWFAFYDNLEIAQDGSFGAAAKPREEPSPRMPTTAAGLRMLSDRPSATSACTRQSSASPRVTTARP